MISTAALIFGFVLMWILAWLTATPVRVVRAALRRVEEGDLRGDLVVFDGTELGELQRGFNSMVDGLRERERVRDLFGRHVGREVAAAAERDKPELGGEERHVAVVFIDIIGSTQLVTSRPAAEVVQLLNRFFAVIVEEVDRHHGLVNKFEGDAVLAVFGAPNHLDRPEDQALGAARAIAGRLDGEVPECKAGIGVAAGNAVAGNVGAKERFEYTVIGEPVNEAARLCELAKYEPGRLLASSDTVNAASRRRAGPLVFGRNRDAARPRSAHAAGDTGLVGHAVGEHSAAEPKPGVAEAIGIDVTGRAAEQDLHDGHVAQSGQQHRGDRLGVVDLGTGLLRAGPQRLPHDPVGDSEVAHPQFVDQIGRGIGFMKHQPNKIGILGNGLLSRRGDSC